MKRLVYQFTVCLAIGLWPLLALPLYRNDPLTLQVLPYLLFVTLPTVAGFFLVWNLVAAIAYLTHKSKHTYLGRKDWPTDWITIRPMMDQRVSDER